jgi:GNAT superfamily N-acetyltransferase
MIWVTTGPGGLDIESAPSIRAVPSAALSTCDWSALTDLCEAAFNRPWGDFWKSIGPTVHVLAEDPARGILAHAAVLDRLVYPGDAVMRAGYVAAVAVAPDLQRRGLGTKVMEVIDRMIDAQYELGSLGTGSHDFYRRLGWLIWQGPTWIRERDGHLQRSPHNDGGIMVRITPTTPAGLDLTGPIATE